MDQEDIEDINDQEELIKLITEKVYSEIESDLKELQQELDDLKENIQKTKKDKVKKSVLRQKSFAEITGQNPPKSKDYTVGKRRTLTQSDAQPEGKIKKLKNALRSGSESHRGFRKIPRDLEDNNQ